MNPEIENKNYPSDINLEYSLLGWILSENKLISQLGYLQPSDFYSAPYMDIFAAMVKLFSNGEEITPFTIKPLLSKERVESFAEMGGIVQYLGKALIECHLNPWPQDIAKYLHGLSQKRKLFVACEDVMGMDDKKSVEEAAAELSKTIDKINYASPLNDFQSDYEVGEEIIKDLMDNRQPYSTGITRLDNAMGGGLYPGRSYGFAAKKKIGKTVLAGTISMNLAKQGIKHLFVCGEMSPKEIQQRNLARLTDTFPSAFRTDYSKDRAFQNKIAEAVRTSTRNVLFRNAPGLTFDELRRVFTSAVERHGVKGCILDYWQLVGGKGKHQSTSEHLDEVAQWIADFSRKHGTWTIMMAQINQEGNTRGGEGVRLAFDQVYHMKAPGDDPSRSARYLEMMDTRYTKWLNIGSETEDRLRMNEKGPFFEEI
jgi:replicative DNA helicase